MNEPREKFLGISDAINSSSHSFTRVKFSSCFLHCRRCRRGSSWHPLEEDQSRKWVPTWKCTLPFPYECHQGVCHLANFASPWNPAMNTRRLISSCIRPAFPSFPSLRKCFFPLWKFLRQKCSIFFAATVYLGLKLVFHREKKKRNKKSFCLGFLPNSLKRNATNLRW